MQQLHHETNELFEVEFFQDKECTIPFDFTNAKNLYIDGLNGNVTPLIALDKICPTDRNLGITAWTPYLPQNIKIITDNLRIKTLDDITPNLSKYIPEDNAVLFLSEEGCERYMQCFQSHHIGLYVNDGLDKVTLEGSVNAINEFVKNPIKKITIFIPHGTQDELEKANEVEKELKKKYGIEEVNLFVLHLFKDIFIDEFAGETTLEYFKNNREDFYHRGDINNFNKIITTNSTGILPVQDNERLQVIGCKEIFERR